MESEHAPIGFVSFDLDYYSSTSAALRLFKAQDKSVLPRVVCYFDDVVSDGHQLHCDKVGELLAIREFNESAKGDCALAPIGLMSSYTLFPAPWIQQIWVYHRFGHFEYNHSIGV